MGGMNWGGTEESGERVQDEEEEVYRNNLINKDEEEAERLQRRRRGTSRQQQQPAEAAKKHCWFCSGYQVMKLMFRFVRINYIIIIYIHN